MRELRIDPKNLFLEIMTKNNIENDSKAVSSLGSVIFTDISLVSANSSVF